MHPFEWLACAWFAALCAAAPLTAAAGRRRAGVMAGSAAAVALVVLAAREAPATLRAWLPLAYLVGGYWMPGLLAPAVPHPTPFERWLMRTDDVLLRHLPAAPARLTGLLELAYLICYPLVPAAFTVVWTHGDAGDVTRFWLAVLTSGYACYGSIPWLVSRPPRLVEPHDPGSRHLLAHANVFVLGRVSHELTTFPSGHAAVSAAAALMVLPVSFVGGAVVGTVAVAIAVAAVAGRYHYAIDVALGLLVAVVSAALSIGL